MAVCCHIFHCNLLLIFLILLNIVLLNVAGPGLSKLVVFDGLCFGFRLHSNNTLCPVL